MDRTAVAKHGALRSASTYAMQKAAPLAAADGWRSCRPTPCALPGQFQGHCLAAAPRQPVQSQSAGQPPFRPRVLHRCQCAVEAPAGAPLESTDDHGAFTPPAVFDYDAPAWVRERNTAFAERLRGKLILAPLTKGGNVPFRRLCAHYGCDVTLSEMSFSKPLLKGEFLVPCRHCMCERGLD